VTYKFYHYTCLLHDSPTAKCTCTHTVYVEAIKLNNEEKRSGYVLYSIRHKSIITYSSDSLFHVTCELKVFPCALSCLVPCWVPCLWSCVGGAFIEWRPSLMILFFIFFISTLYAPRQIRHVS
jgi:hypothetical protein